MPSVNPEILSWARTSGGLSLAEAAHKLGISQAYGKSPEQRLGDLEAGRQEPSRPMLVKMERIYRRPLVAFYLGHPPGQSRRATDFRALAAEDSQPEHFLVEALVREMLARQSLVHDVLAEEQADEVSFVGTVSRDRGVPHAVAVVRNLLGCGQSSGATRAREAFDKLRARAERAGAFVLLKGDLGSHHTDLETDVFRGLSLVDRLAPFIVINDNDAKPAWSFTLVHEFVHLLLGSSTCSSARDETELEQFCDDVASFFLLPPVPINDFRATGIALEGAVSEVAREWRVSRTLVAYRLLRAGKIARPDYERLAAEFKRSWQLQRKSTRERNRQSEGGPSFYVTKRHRTGQALLDLVRRSHFERSLPTTRAATVLGVKPTQVQAMLAG